jgi:hypothetical protein
MSLYNNMRKTAGRMLAVYGSIVTIKRRASGDYNESTGEATMQAQNIYSGFALVSDFPIRMVNGTSVLSGDKSVTLEASETMVEPQAGDFVVIGAADHRVISVSKVAPGGTTIIYKMQARK